VPSPGDQLRRAVAALPGGGEARDGQVTMAEAVWRSLEEGRHLVARAGTGTGKSLAYLVPAVLWGKPVVVATATKALQDQLAGKDLPFLRKALGRRFEFAVLKGRSNYLCVQRAREVLDTGEQGAFAPVEATPVVEASGRLGDEVRRLVAWGETTSTGDRAELDFEPAPRAWSLVSVSATECPGANRCPSGGDCFAEKARHKAAEADIVVVNMHLYGAHLASGGAVLPEHDAVVFDEAHELEDVLAASLGFEVGPGRVRALAAGAGAALAGSAGGGRRGAGAGTGSGPAVTDLFDVATQLEKVLVQLDGERIPPGAGGALAEVLALLGTRLGRVEADLREAAKAAREAGGQGADLLARCTRAQLALEHCRSEVASVPQAGPDQVVWVEGGERSPRLRVAPVDVSGVMAAQVFEQMPVVLTTATAPRGLGGRLGAAPDELDEIDVGSPFPYEEHALLYCAARVPDRRRAGEEAATAAVHAELEALIRAAGGRTMALFTSWRAMRGAVEELRRRLPYRIFSQEELPKPALLTAFTAEAESCLFATMSFWQGVDVPGPTLSLVVIDRLPFPRPDDPLMSARRERAGAAAFKTIDVPRAATLLAQGAGRLIRTAEDRGVVAVLDARLSTAASYRWDLVNALPPMRRTKDRAEVEAFLRGLRDG
jgi:ATP-dependent DNA helicase DinG